jgi:LPXTG-motif cell wall-anchored protein
MADNVTIAYSFFHDFVTFTTSPPWLFWGFILFVALTILFLIFKKKKKKGIGKKCKHLFHPRGFLTVQNLPRMVQVCSKCNAAIHTPIYTSKKLAEIEDAN